MKKKLLPLIITLLIFEWDMHANAQLEMVSTNLIDIGTLYNDNVATNHFTFINRGKADIKILDLISTCPCIHAKKDRDIISPGETFIMETVLNAQTVHGRFTRGIWMITDNPGQPRIPVKVSGEVLPLFSGIPTQEIILQSLDESAVFTNRLSFKPVTTNYFLNPPLANINQPNVSATLTKDENNIYHLTTIIHPDNVQLNTYNVNLPVEGPVKMSPVNLRFKVLAGVTLTASPSRLIVTRMEETYKKTFYVNIASSEKKPENPDKGIHET